MSSDFVCKECGWRSEVVSAIFQIEMAANYTHDGKDFRQHSLRVVDYTLNEDMDTAVTVCPNCDNSGTITECYNQIFMCRNCGKDVGDNGGHCGYNVGMYCSKCYKKFKTNCEGCTMSDACGLRITNLSKTERIKESLKVKDVSELEPDMHSEMSDELREPRNFDAIPESEADGGLTNRYARDMSSMVRNSGTGWNMPSMSVSDDDEDDDNFLEEDDE